MKKFFKPSILLLILFYSLERFTYSSFNVSLILYFVTKLNITTEQVDLYRNLLYIANFISLLFAALLIDSVKVFRNLKIYFIPIFAGLLLCIPNTYGTILSGVLLITIASSFIRINVFLKIFDNVHNESGFDDRSLILLYLILNIFTGFAPLVTGHFENNLLLGYILPNLIVWGLFTLLYLFINKENVPKKVNFKNPSFQKRTMPIISLIILGVLARYYIVSQLQNMIFENEVFPEYNALTDLILYSFGFFVGIIFLFLKQVQQFGKIIIGLIVTFLIGLFVLLFQNYTFNQEELVFTFIRLANSSIAFLLYPAIYALIMLNSPAKYRGATLAAIFLLYEGLSYLNNWLQDSNYLIPVIISLLVLFLLLILLIRFRNKEKGYYIR